MNLNGKLLKNLPLWCLEWFDFSLVKNVLYKWGEWGFLWEETEPFSTIFIDFDVKLLIVLFNFLESFPFLF